MAEDKKNLYFFQNRLYFKYKGNILFEGYNMDVKKQWYIIRKRGGSTWVAYEITKEDIEGLLPEYEFKGPYRSLVQCLIHQ